MIEATSARAYDEIEARADELYHAYTPGYQPAHRSARSTTVRSDVSPSQLDVVAPEHAFFVAVDGHGRRFYSRNGSLRIADGVLTTQNGSTVLGFSGTGSELAPLRLDPVDVATGRAQDPRIEADGTVAYTRTAIDPRTGFAKPERVTVGRIALARFPAGTDVSAADGVHVTAPPEITPTISVPGENGFAKVAVGRIDRGNYDPRAGLAELRDAYTMFDAIRAAAVTRSKSDKTMMDLIK